MKKTGLKNAYAIVRQKITTKMLNMPACVPVQMRTTVREVSMFAASAESSLMFFLMYSTAR